MTSISHNIITLRKQIGLSQQQVALYLNVPHTIISNYENCKYIPTHKYLSKLADLFNVEIEELLKENKNLHTQYPKLNNNDIIQITQFKKIVKNYLKVHTIQIQANH